MAARCVAAVVDDIYVGGMQFGQFQHCGELLSAGNAEVRKGHREKALGYYEAAIHEHPDFWPGYYMRGWLYLDAHKWALAKQDANTILHLDSRVYEAELLRAYANLGANDCAGFLHDVNAVIALWSSRNFHSALNIRAWFLATWPDAKWRNGRQAVHDASEAAKITKWKQPHIIDTLAAAYAETGDFDSAVKYEEQAIATLHEVKAPEYVERLMLYRQHQPYRQSAKE